MLHYIYKSLGTSWPTRANLTKEIYILTLKHMLHGWLIYYSEEDNRHALLGLVHFSKLFIWRNYQINICVVFKI